MASSKKKYVFIAGVNGTGKSTLYSMIPDFKKMVRINVDEIARELGDWRDTTISLEAGKMAIKLREECLNNGENINQETTLGGHDAIRTAKRADQLGYEVIMYYVGVDSIEICKQRIRNRVVMGGHGIPEEDIERRYSTSFENLKKLMPICKKIYFYDNTEEMTLFCRYIGGKFYYEDTKTPQWFIRNVLQ